MPATINRKARTLSDFIVNKLKDVAEQHGVSLKKISPPHVNYDDLLSAIVYKNLSPHLRPQKDEVRNELVSYLFSPDHDLTSSYDPKKNCSFHTYFVLAATQKTQLISSRMCSFAEYNNLVPQIGNFNAGRREAPAYVDSLNNSVTPDGEVQDVDLRDDKPSVVDRLISMENYELFTSELNRKYAPGSNRDKIFQLLMGGKSLREIADFLDLTYSTVHRAQHDFREIYQRITRV